MSLMRQIHLDFHCSEQIKDIGSRFNKQEFQEYLLKAKVSSINLFAKYHHGTSYCNKVIKMHPHLNFDLLGQQISACKIGINCSIYIAVGWSANDAENHPEWCAEIKMAHLL